MPFTHDQYETVADYYANQFLKNSEAADRQLSEAGFRNDQPMRSLARLADVTWVEFPPAFIEAFKSRIVGTLKSNQERYEAERDSYFFTTDKTIPSLKIFCTDARDAFRAAWKEAGVKDLIPPEQMLAVSAGLSYS